MHTKHGYAEVEANIVEGMYEVPTDWWNNDIFRNVRLIDTHSQRHDVATSNKRLRNQSGDVESTCYMIPWKRRNQNVHGVEAGRR